MELPRAAWGFSLHATLFSFTKLHFLKESCRAGLAGCRCSGGENEAPITRADKGKIILQNGSRTIRDCGSLMPKYPALHGAAILVHELPSVICAGWTSNCRAGWSRNNRTCSIFCEFTQPVWISSAARIPCDFMDNSVISMRMSLKVL